MVAGYWVNQDGLGLQFGTQKAIPELGGDYLIYGENREVEQYIPLVPTNWGTGMPAVAAPPTSLTFPVSASQTTPQSVGIQAYTTFMPLQLTVPQSASGSALSITNPQLFIERVELVCLQTVAPTTNTMTIGLVTTQSQTPVTSAPYIQITPNAGVQIIGAGTPLTLNTAVGTVGDYTLFTTSGVAFGGAPGAAFGGTAGTGGGVPIATTGNGGAWIGNNVPLVTNTNFDPATSAQTLPQEAWISTLTSGAFTAGLLKLRVKYFIYGNINY
jgi:hypothetical protein